jgi:mRNA interferase MazF
MEIMQGDIFWVDLGEPSGSGPGYKHPYVIIQNDVFNASKINTAIGIALTSNTARAGIPGNVLLKKGEANLSKGCVVNVSRISTIDKYDLKTKIGQLSVARIHEILEGLYLITEPKELS